MEKLLKIDELSDLLGISRRTLYDWTHTGFIPCYKFPKGVRFKASTVEKWLTKRKRKGRIKQKISI